MNENVRNLMCVFIGLMVIFPTGSFANEDPVVQILSAAMRPDTTLMDITYRINDPDDATVKVRALAFVDGVRSFANVLRPVTFVEGTEGNLGDAITTGVEHTLTWDVGADWDVDLAQVKFEILAMDDRSLLPFDWITIPATAETEEVTVSKSLPTNAQILDALFWVYADGGEELLLENGSVLGTAASGVFEDEVLVQDATLSPNVSTIFLYKQMGLSTATFLEKDLMISARAGITDRYVLYASSCSWGSNIGIDSTAVTSEVVGWRWVKHTYADGAVTMSDRVTGLMWPYSANITGNIHWYAAMSYCSGLVYAGYDDWILPDVDTLAEMYSQKTFFVDVVEDAGWSYHSTTPWGSSDVYGVNMSTGIRGHYPKSNTRYVWPVRGNR